MRKLIFLLLGIFLIVNVTAISWSGGTINIINQTINQTINVTGGFDGNASSICLGDEVLLGNGTCMNSTLFQTGGGASGNPFDQILNVSSNVTFASVNVTNNVSSSGWFNGLFNWTVSSIYATFTGALLTINDALLNTNFNQTAMIQNENATWSSTFNQSYAGSLNNASYLSTFNQSYEDFSYNFTDVSGGGTGNVSQQFNIILGFTTSGLTGNMSNSTTLGYVRANQVCASNFTGSHFCLKSEVLKNIANGNFTFTGTAWFQNGPPGFTARASDCDAWTTSDGVALGPFWNWDRNVQAGQGALTSCAQSKPLMCCG